MRLKANVRVVRIVGNVFAILYLAVAVLGYLASLNMVGKMQQVDAQTITDGADTSFYLNFYTVGFVGVVLSLFGLFLAWKLFHMFLDMYEAIAEMQGKMVRFE